jgi:hypothetical protein
MDKIDISEIIDLKQLDALKSKFEGIYETLNKELEVSKNKASELTKEIEEQIKGGNVSYSQYRRLKDEAKQIVTEHNRINGSLNSIKGVLSNIDDIQRDIVESLGAAVYNSEKFNETLVLLDKNSKDLATNLGKSVLNLFKISTYKNAIKDISTFFKELGQSNNKLKFTLEGVKKGLSGLGSVGKNALDILLNQFSDLIETIVEGGEFIVSSFKAVINRSLVPLVENSINIFSSLFNSVKNLFSGNFKDAKKEIEGVGSAINNVFNSIKSIGDIDFGGLFSNITKIRDLKRELKALEIINKELTNSLLEQKTLLDGVITSQFSSQKQINTAKLKQLEIDIKLLEINEGRLKKELEIQTNLLKIYEAENNIKKINETKLAIADLNGELLQNNANISNLKDSYSDFIRQLDLDTLFARIKQNLFEINKDLIVFNENLEFIGIENRANVIENKLKDIKEKFIKVGKEIYEAIDFNRLFDIETIEQATLFLENVPIEVRDKVLEIYQEYRSIYTDLKNTQADINSQIVKNDIEAIKQILTANNEYFIKTTERTINNLNSLYNEGLLQGRDFIKETEFLYNDLIKAINKKYKILLDNTNLTNLEKEALLEQKKIEIYNIVYEKNKRINDVLFEQNKLIKEINAQTENIRIENRIKKIEEANNILNENILLNYSKIREAIELENRLREEQLANEFKIRAEQAKTQEELFAIYNQYTEKLNALQLDTNKKLYELIKQYNSKIVDEINKGLDGILEGFNRRFDRQNRIIEQKSEVLNKLLEIESIRISKGLSSNYDELLKQQTKFQAEQRKNEKKRRDVELAISLVRSFNEYLKTNKPQVALGLALKDTLLVKGLSNVIAGAFAEGVENFQGKGTETSDSNLVLISRGESVITAKATKQYKGLATAMNEGKVEQWINNNYNTLGNIIDSDALGNIIKQNINRNVKTIIKQIVK